MKKIISRIRRANKTRCKIKEMECIRLIIHRTSRHIYAQIIDTSTSMVLATASTIEKNIRKNLKYSGNKEAAIAVGKIISKRAIKNGIQHVAFDRSGFKYHGRIKALAESARENGLIF